MRAFREEIFGPVVGLDCPHLGFDDYFVKRELQSNGKLSREENLTNGTTNA
ncbi:MAG: hypothetical protein NTZ35_03995 [Ignavibacteriales bacterium]|nr:hypothetical protein [Ignavibacteriales bacterium]